MSPLLLPIAHLRRLEALAAQSLPEGTLMARAASALVREAGQLAQTLPRAMPIDVLVGYGNNGADALLAAMGLHRLGFTVRVHATSRDAPSAPDALRVHRQWAAQGGRFEADHSLAQVLSNADRAGSLVIDGLFGIGLNRPVAGPSLAMIDLVNRSPSLVLAVDVPSGLQADTGMPVGGAGSPVLRADRTLTFIADKPGLHTGEGPALSGQVVIDSLDLDEKLAALPADEAHTDSASPPVGWLMTEARVCRLVRPRLVHQHKGQSGSVLVLGGAPDMRGAGYLAALAAQAGGAGKVYLACPDDQAFDPAYPQLMSRHFDAPLTGLQGVAVGCGLGQGPAMARRLRQVLDAPVACVIDADGLNLLAAHPDLVAQLRDRSEPAILSPHPLEAARLLGRDTPSVQDDRLRSARRLAQITGAVVVLKGAGSIIAAPDGRWSINTTGSAALATGGTGDVLAGLLAALLAQGYAPFEAAQLGAWIHGRAGDRWHRQHPQGAGLNPLHLTTLLPAAWPDGMNL